jgi:cell division septum initiation protein DivIVA
MFKQVLDENKRLQEKVEELEEKLRDCLRDN